MHPVRATRVQKRPRYHVRSVFEMVRRARCDPFMDCSFWRSWWSRFRRRRRRATRFSVCGPLIPRAGAVRPTSRSTRKTASTSGRSSGWLSRSIRRTTRKERRGSRRPISTTRTPTLQNKPVIGLIIVKDFVYKGDGQWHKGTIYDPDNGKTYKCKIKFGDNEKVLKVRGFIGVSLLGRTTLWTRVEDKE